MTGMRASAAGAIAPSTLASIMSAQPTARRTTRLDRQCVSCEPVHNVELRARPPRATTRVVFAFPYRADIVDAVRAIPGRRFDWEAKEWWAPQADATAPYVKGVLERHAVADASRPTSRRGSRAPSTGWVGRVTAGKLDGSGRVRARDDRRRAARAARGAGRRARRAARGCRSRSEVAEALLEMPGARLDQRALRCATRLQVDQRAGAGDARRSSRASASRASSSTSTGTRRRSPPSSRCPPARRTGARCRSTRTCSSRSSTTCARSASRSPPTRREVLERLRRRARRGDRRTSAARARTTRPRWRSRRASAASCGRSSAPASRTCSRRGARSWPTSRGSARPCRRSPRWRPTTPTRPSSSARRSLKLNWQREIEHWLPHRSVTVVSGTGGVARGRRHHGHQLRDRPRAPRAARAAPARRRSCSTSRTTSRTRAPSARRRCAGWPSRWPRTRCGSR